MKPMKFIILIIVLLSVIACKSNKVQADSVDEIECKTIFQVIENCSIDELEVWLKKDSSLANYRDTTAYKKTALMYAAKNNDLARFNLLLDFGADPFAYVDNHIHPQYDVLYVALKYDADDILREIIKRNFFDLNKKYNDCENAIYTSVRNNSPKTLSILIDNGVNIHVIDECEGANGNSPLSWAVMERSLDATKVLIKHGADVNRIEEDMHTVLGVACFTYENKGSFDIIKLLVENGANVNKANSLNFTPLMMCAFRANNEPIEFLVKNGAKINEKTSSGYTALHYATNNDHIETAKLLIKLGSDPNIRDNQGNLAVDLFSNKKLRDEFTTFLK
jgi:ankyrin repeat protein